MTLITWGFGWRIFGALTNRLDDGGRVTTVTGPIASGKTRLLDMLAQFASTNNITVLRARCFPAGRMTPLNVPAQLLAGHGATVGESAADDAVDLIRFATTRDQPALALVDDLRYIDDASACFLANLAARIANEPILLVLADRLPAVRDNLDRIEDPAARLRSRSISLTTLSPAETRDVAEYEFGLRLEPDVAAQIHALARGNLRMVRAVIEDTIASGDVSVPVPGNAYRQAALEGLHSLTPEAREIAMAAAALGGGCDLPALTASSGLDRSAVAAALVELDLCCMLDEDRLTPATRQAVLSDMSQARLKAYLRHAVAMKPAAAILPPSPAEREQACVAPREENSPAIPVVPGAGYEALHEVRAAVRMLDHEIERIDDISGSADLEATQLLTCCEFPDLLRDFLRRHPQRRLPDHIPDSSRYQAAWAMARSMIEPGANPDPAQSAVDALTRCPRTDEAMPALVAAIVALIHQQDWERARSWCDQLLAEGREQSAMWRAHLHVARAEVQLRVGETTGARSDAAHAIELLPTGCWGVRVGWPLSILVMVACLTGDHDGAARHLKASTPELMYETPYGVSYRYARGHYYLATGEVRLALADFLGCGRVTQRWQVDLSAYSPWQTAAAATYLAIGDYPSAARLIDENRRSLELRGQPAADLEATFDLLSRATDTATLTKTITAIQRGGSCLAGSPDVAQYKIHDRYSSYLAKLSRSEQPVAVLAAKGLTNQLIAKELSLTVSTVEQHLTRIYRKLGIAGRNQLRALLG